MSFFRPRFLDDFIKPLGSASPRVRGLKSFDPQAVIALQDALYADDPTFWVLGADLAAVALNFGHIGVQTPNDDSLVCIVDGVLVGTGAQDAVAVDVVAGGALLLALATNDAVFRRNRRELARTTGLERVGLLKITDNANAFAGTTIASARNPANTMNLIPLGFRLYGSEQLFVRNITTSVVLTATMFGRLTTKGQR